MTKRIDPKLKRELTRLAALPDSTIDLSDIPEVKRIPADATIGKLYRPVKRPITIRLDADVLAWVRGTGEGRYQTRINSILRQAMQRRQRRRK